MQTVLTRNEITRKTIANFFKEILNYKFISCDCYKYAIIIGKYNFCFGDKSLYIEYSVKIITSICVSYKDIEKIEVYIGEDGELYLQIDIDNGVKVIFDENGAGIEFKEKVKAELYEN